MNPANRQNREALLGELESIRNLLDEDRQDVADRALVAASTDIPLLIPEEDAVQHIPLLSAVAVDTTPHEAPAIPQAAAPDPLAAIREAAAKVAARTTGNSGLTASAHDREKLVDDVVRAALPRLELLLRELVQDALLQDKLRGGKR